MRASPGWNRWPIMLKFIALNITRERRTVNFNLSRVRHL
jgi:hypothetical protein